jgi:hypothetical protein
MPNVRAKLTAEACVAWPRKDTVFCPWSGQATHAVAGQLERVVRRHQATFGKSAFQNELSELTRSRKGRTWLFVRI